MTDLFDQQITDSLHRTVDIPDRVGSFSDVRRRVRARRNRRVAAAIAPAVTGLAWIGMRPTSEPTTLTPAQATDSTTGSSEPMSTPSSDPDVDSANTLTSQPTDTMSSSSPKGAPAFAFETPTVRLTAHEIKVGVSNPMSPPITAAVYSDPGNVEYTSLDLTWNDPSNEQRLFISFASDGTSWWADTIRTYDDNGEWIDSPVGQRWFASPIGQAWSGDLNLPNVRITGMILQAFLRPSCDNPTSPIILTVAYPTMEGIAESSDRSLGFGQRVDLIDTSTCTLIDPTPYTFTATAADPTVAEIFVYDRPLGSTTTIVGQPSAAAEVSGLEVDGRFDVAFRNAGETTVQVTVADIAGTIIGTVTMPVIVRPPDSSVGATANTVVEQGA